MKVLVVGYGSMGRRRIRLVKREYPDAEIICVDSNPERAQQAKESGINVYGNLDTAILESPDYGFVCTSPGHHAELILKLIENGIDIFTELNLLDSRYDIILEEAERNGVKVFMSSTMIYNRQIMAIKDRVSNLGSSVSYSYHVGQYLPDWHPWENYKDYFVSKKETNACREILAIQLPWITDVFGDIENITAVLSRNSNLEIDYPDTYHLLVKHKNGNSGLFLCDVVSRVATTSLEVIAQDMHLMWDGTIEGLKEYSFSENVMVPIATYETAEHIEGYADNIIEDDYLDEVRAFFAYVIDGVEPRYSISKDAVILSLINEIEKG